MQVEISCVKCKVALRVPAEAAGHRARCPACGHQFQVPTVDALLEDTVSEWIEEDVEEIFEHRERVTEQRLATAPSEHIDGSGPRAQEPRPAHRPERSNRGGRAFWPRRTGQTDAVPSGASLPGAGGRVSSSPMQELVVTHDGDHDGGHDLSHGHRYPRSLKCEPSRPYLSVRQVDAAGVRFAFEAKWLEDEGFRASFPMRCAFSGIAARAKLIARPLVFKDRLFHHTPEEVIAPHENRQVGDMTPRHVARRMGTLEHLPEPFCFAVPYYVSTRFAHLSLHTRVRSRSDGDVICDVLVPDASTALEWLGRVNGVCGKEYELLEADAALLHGDAWQQLSDTARQRISAWCKLGAHEVVRHFFSDADFGRHDEGLAGLILTDHRLIFHKYHHGGEAALNTEDATVLARPEGSFVNLTLRTGNDLSRMIKLHQNDMDRLEHALQERGAIRLVVSE